MQPWDFHQKHLKIIIIPDFWTVDVYIKSKFTRETDFMSACCNVCVCVCVCVCSCVWLRWHLWRVTWWSSTSGCCRPRERETHWRRDWPKHRSLHSHTNTHTHTPLSDPGTRDVCTHQTCMPSLQCIHSPSHWKPASIQKTQSAPLPLLKLFLVLLSTIHHCMGL